MLETIVWKQHYHWADSLHLCMALFTGLHLFIVTTSVTDIILRFVTRYNIVLLSIVFDLSYGSAR